ncbi:hypothetical protein ACX93W_19615 [Paenibacillus sp. CAU 1782]
MNQLHRTMWNGLNTEEKQRSLRDILPDGFTFQRIETFERYGQQLETAVFSFEGSEFVFVPGDDITLGWEGWDGDSNVVREALKEDLMILDESLEQAEQRLRGVTTPLRKISIQPMLAERHPCRVGWTEITIEEAENSELAERLEAFRQNRESNRQYYPDCRLDRDGEQIIVYRFNKSEDFEEWADWAINGDFDIPTEDEWEYLYGAGCRTLFPWGDGISEAMRVLHNDEHSRRAALSSNGNRPARSFMLTDNLAYDRLKPNGFGLFFLRDPYQKELATLEDDGYTGKGGDGGGAHHANLNAFYTYLPTSVYYRDHHEDEIQWTEWLDQLHYRRIIRL